MSYYSTVVLIWGGWLFAEAPERFTNSPVSGGMASTGDSSITYAKVKSSSRERLRSNLSQIIAELDTARTNYKNSRENVDELQAELKNLEVLVGEQKKLLQKHSTFFEEAQKRLAENRKRISELDEYAADLKKNENKYGNSGMMLQEVQKKKEERLAWEKAAQAESSKIISLKQQTQSQLSKTEINRKTVLNEIRNWRKKSQQFKKYIAHLELKREQHENLMNITQP